MAFSFPALTKALTGAAVARRQGKDDAAESRRSRRRESLQELLFRSQNPQIVESETGEFSLDPSLGREAQAATRQAEAAQAEEQGQRQSLAQAIEQGFLPKDTRYRKGVDYTGTLNELAEDVLRRAGTQPTAPTAKQTADIGLTRARTRASEALAENRERPRQQDSALNKRLDAVVEDIRKFERDQAGRDEFTPQEPGRTERRLDRIAQLHGFDDFRHILRLQSQRGGRRAGEPEPEPEQPDQQSQVDVVFESIVGSNAPPDAKALAQQIAESELSPADKLIGLQELIQELQRLAG